MAQALTTMSLKVGTTSPSLAAAFSLARPSTAAVMSISACR
jgi:hypothetical protein